MIREKTDRPGLTKNFDEKLFRLLINNINDYAIFMIDPNGYIMSWNIGAEHIKGYTEDEIIGKHISVFYTEEDNKNNIPRYNLYEALKNGSYESEGWRIKKDGSAFWANVTFTTVYDDKGHLVGIAKITRDITARKKNEDKKEKANIELEKRVKENTEKIIANELRFRKLIENSHDGITLLDKDFHVFFRSTSSKQITGWNNNERVGHEFYDLIYPEDRGEVKQALTDVLNKPDTPIFVSYRHKHKLGHYVWMECMFTNMFYDANINAIVCNFRDITERKKAETELKNKTEQIESILESITDGFIALDKDFNYTYVNKRLGEMVGRTPESLLGKYIWTEFPDAVNSETFKAFNKAMNKRQYMVNQDYFPPLDLWQENHIYPSPNGGLSVFIRDISERKRAEIEIQQLNTSLEKKVTERTLQLQAANKELEAFSYSVSHDLRTPLRAVNGYAMMLKEDFEDKLGEEGNRVIGTIINNASMMGRLIDDLLAFSRLGRKELTLNEVDMNAMVKGCITELLENESKKPRIKINKLPACETDSTLLKQVWLNLVSNAIKYSAKSESPQIEIGFKEQDGNVTYFVKDNGVGFDMQYSNKLFGVFQRLHRNDEFEGTGVGLALVKRIIDKHGGKIWADASPGKGATFYFTLH